MKDLRDSLKANHKALLQFCDENDLSAEQKKQLVEIANQLSQHASEMPESDCPEAGGWVDHAKWLIDAAIKLSLWFFE